MNEQVFNSEHNPLFANCTSNSPLLTAALDGNSYLASVDIAGTVTAGYYAMRILNPSDSAKDIYINNIYVANTGLSTYSSLNLYKNAGFTDTPAVLTANNTNFGSSNTTAATIEGYQKATSPVSGGTVFETAYQVAMLYNWEYDGSIVIPPGSSLMLLAGNIIGVNTKLNIKIVYWEQAKQM